MLSFQQMLICFACAGPCWCASTTSSTCCVSRSWEFRSTPSTPSQWASLSSRPNPSTSTHGSFETWSNFSVLPACVTLILGFFPLHRRVIVRKFLSNVSVESLKKKNAQKCQETRKTYLQLHIITSTPLYGNKTTKSEKLSRGLMASVFFSPLVFYKPSKMTWAIMLQG